MQEFSYLEVQLDELGIAMVTMQRPKVNALNEELIQQLRKCFAALNKDDQVNGVILTGQPGIFSAGLDVLEIYGLDEAQMKSFFTNFSLLYKELVLFKKPFICAISGHSPAGGTVLALCADYRLMAEGEHYTIGLNEVAVNIQISNAIYKAYQFWIGDRKAHQYILEGKLVQVKEALACGMIDEIQPIHELLVKAKEKMKKYLQAESNIWQNTKRIARREWVDVLDQFDEKDTQRFLEVWWSPSVRKKFTAFVKNLQQRGDKK